MRKQVFRLLCEQNYRIAMGGLASKKCIKGNLKILVFEFLLGCAIVLDRFLAGTLLAKMIGCLHVAVSLLQACHYVL